MGFLSDIGKAAKSVYDPFGIGNRIMNPAQFSPSGYAQSRPEFTPGKYSSGIAMPERVQANNMAAYKAKEITGPLPEYEALRQRVSQQANRDTQGAQEALQRRFAAMGALGSGAGVKQEQLARQKIAQQRDANLNDIGFQEAQQRRGLQQEEANKEFQSQEAFKNRELQVADFNFRQNLGMFDAQSKLRQMDIAGWQTEMDTVNNQFNKEMEMYKAQHTGGLFGAGGFLGLGI